MARTNDYVPFGTGVSANVMSQADWLALTARTHGFIEGIAKSPELNKAWRQALFTAAALWEYVGQRLNVDTLDDGDLNGAVARLASAIVSAAGGLEQTVITNQAVGAANNRAYYVNTVAVTYTLASSTSLTNAFRASIHALGGDATLVINGADAINGGTAGVGLTIPRGFLATVTADGATGILVSMVKAQTSVTTLSGTATLRPDQFGLVLVDTSSAGFVGTLPAGAGLKGFGYKFIKVSADVNSFTLAKVGSDSIVDSRDNLGNTISPVLKLQYESFDFLTDGASPAKWFQPGPSKKNAVSALMETGLANVNVGALSNGFLSANARLLGDGTWNRQNVAAAAAALKILNSGVAKLLTAPAGANPIAWTEDVIWTDSGASFVQQDQTLNFYACEAFTVTFPNGHGFSFGTLIDQLNSPSQRTFNVGDFIAAGFLPGLFLAKAAVVMSHTNLVWNATTTSVIFGTSAGLKAVAGSTSGLYLSFVGAF